MQRLKDDLAQLQQASADVAEARVEQMKASGRAPAAAAQKTADAIAKTREDQQAADQAAEALAQASKDLGMEGSAIEKALFSDLKENHVLIAFDFLAAGSLVALY